MKKVLHYGALLAVALCPSLSCSSISLKATDTQPITEKPRAITQALLPAIQEILWFCLLARFNYLNEKKCQVTQWQFDDLAPLKAIKENAMRLWSIHMPDRKIIRLEDWRRDSI
jgi:hypothetical protein